MEISGWSIAAIIAVLGVAGTLWRQIYGFFKSISNFILGRIYVDENIAAAIYYYCSQELDIINLRHRTLFGSFGFLKKEQTKNLICFDDLINTSVLYRRGIRLVWIKPGYWMYDSSRNQYVRTGQVLLPRIFWNQKKFIEKAVASYNNRKEKIKYRRFFIQRIVGQGKGSGLLGKPDEKNAVMQKSTFATYLSNAYCGKSFVMGQELDNICADNSSGEVSPFDIFPYPENIMSSVHRAKAWYDNESWFLEKAIPWRRGWLVTGEPGTGKTLLLRCLAEELDIPILIFDLSSLTNQEFFDEFNKLNQHTPCMIVFEDLDSVFNGRENITKKEDGLTFDAFLNAISGIQQCNGLFIAITTNHPDKLDSAIGIAENGKSTRPGRIDEIIHIGPMTEECKTRFANRVIPDYSINRLLSETKDYTAAQFTEYCNQIALKEKLNVS